MGFKHLPNDTDFGVACISDWKRYLSLGVIECAYQLKRIADKHRRSVRK